MGYIIPGNMISMVIKNNDYNLVNVAIVGYGYIAQYWEKAISQDGRINIAGIYDNGIAGSKITGHRMYKNLANNIFTSINFHNLTQRLPLIW